MWLQYLTDINQSYKKVPIALLLVPLYSVWTLNVQGVALFFPAGTEERNGFRKRQMDGLFFFFFYKQSSFENAVTVLKQWLHLQATDGITNPPLHCECCSIKLRPGASAGSQQSARLEEKNWQEPQLFLGKRHYLPLKCGRRLYDDITLLAGFTKKKKKCR